MYYLLCSLECVTDAYRFQIKYECAAEEHRSLIKNQLLLLLPYTALRA